MFAGFHFVTSIRSHLHALSVFWSFASSQNKESIAAKLCFALRSKLRTPCVVWIDPWLKARKMIAGIRWKHYLSPTTVLSQWQFGPIECGQKTKGCHRAAYNEEQGYVLLSN